MSDGMDARSPGAQQERGRRGEGLQRKVGGGLMRRSVSHESLLRYEDNTADGDGGLDSLAPKIKQFVEDKIISAYNDQSLMPGSPIIIQAGGHATYNPMVSSRYRPPRIPRPRIKNLRHAISAANLHKISEGHSENQYQEGINNVEEHIGNDDNESVNNANEPEDGGKNADEEAKNAGGGGGADDIDGVGEKGESPCLVNEKENPAGKRSEKYQKSTFTSEFKKPLKVLVVAVVLFFLVGFVVMSSANPVADSGWKIHKDFSFAMSKFLTETGNLVYGTRFLDSCCLNDTHMDESTWGHFSFYGKCIGRGIHKGMDHYWSFVVRETGILSKRIKNYVVENLRGLSTGNSTSRSEEHIRNSSSEHHTKSPAQGILFLPHHGKKKYVNQGILEPNFCSLSHGRMCRVTPLFHSLESIPKESMIKEKKEDTPLNAQRLSREDSQALVEVKEHQDDDTEYSDWLCASMEEGDNHESSIPAEENSFVESEPSVVYTTPTVEVLQVVLPTKEVVEERESPEMMSQSVLVILTGSNITILLWSCLKKRGSRKQNPKRRFQRDHVGASRSKSDGKKYQPASRHLRSPITPLGSFIDFEDLVVHSEGSKGREVKQHTPVRRSIRIRRNMFLSP